MRVIGGRRERGRGRGRGVTVREREEKEKERQLGREGERDMEGGREAVGIKGWKVKGILLYQLASVIQISAVEDISSFLTSTSDEN